MDWSSCVNTFINVAKANSFTKAAQNMHLPRTTVSRHVQWLEDEIGQVLLKRTTRKVQLTEAGELLYQQSLPLINEWSALQRRMTSAHNTPQGILRIATAPQLAKLFLANLIPHYLEHYPDIRISLEDTSEPLNLLEQNIDIYIGFEPMVKDKANVAGRFLAEFPRQCYASPEYLKKHGTPSSPKDLRQHRCITWKGRTHWEFDQKKFRINDYLSTNSAETIQEFGIKGVGIIYTPEFLARKNVQAGHLIPILKNHKPNVCKVYAYYPKLTYLPKKVELFLNCLKKGVQCSF